MFNSSISLDKLPPLSLYIHIPWCVKKCPYCDFNSHQVRAGNVPENQYVDALLLDLEQLLPLIWGRSVKSIFIGGGTPSIFSGDAINRLLSNVRAIVNLSPFAEITMEMNPATVDYKHINAYKLAGINRVSFGVQSFKDKYLKKLGRIHSAVEAITVIEQAGKIFDNINIDVIYGLPEQSLVDVVEDIDEAILLNPAHISCYNLSIEPNTYFYRNVPKALPDNDLCYEMQQVIIARLAEAGYNRYEISAYARNSKFAIHNLNYWQFGDYAGIGAGSHSKISFCDKVIRQLREKHPATYMNKVLSNNHVIENTQVEIKSLAFEFAMNAFRLVDGVSVSLFTERCGLPLNALLPKLQIAQEKGLLVLCGDHIRPTQLGLDFLNDLLILFLED